MTAELVVTAGATATITALRQALAGGPAVGPLPPSGNSDQTLAILQPDVALEADDIAAVITTSGSSGPPKGVLLSRSAIAAAATATHDRLYGPGRWLLALPTHYVAGLMVAARALLSGTEPLEVGKDLAGLAGLISSDQPTYLSLVSVQLARALQVRQLAAALAQLDAVLVGGGRVAPELLERAQAAGVRVIITYGMSETCGGCVYDQNPLPGVTVRLEPQSQRIILGGPVLFSGYRLDPQRTAAALVAGELRTSDRGKLVDGRLQVTGRVDRVVSIGGVNVDLDWVEQQFSAAAAAEVAVVCLPDPTWGTKMILAAGVDLDLAQLCERVAHSAPEMLPGVAQPRELLHVDPLPRTAGGKIDRQKLTDLAAARMRGQL